MIADIDKEKLKQLSELEGVSELVLLERAVIDSNCKGICINDGCTYTTEIEPDQCGGYCEICSTHTVHSCLVLAGII